jgi:hypothetical protein
MDRGPRVPDNIRLLIANIYQEMRKKNPKIKAPAVREAVRCRLTEVPYPGWPGLSVVQKVMIDIRKKEAETHVSEQDEPWCMARLHGNELSPEAIKAVCEVWKADLNSLIDSAADPHNKVFAPINDALLGMREATNLSIREAKWIARLYCTIKNDKKDKEWVKSTRLYSTAELYARAEQLHEILGIPFNSDEMDRHLILGIPKLLKVNRLSLFLLTLWLEKERIPEIELLLDNEEISIALDALLINGKVPEWLIPLVTFGGHAEALKIIRQQQNKNPARMKSTRKGAKK